MSSRKGELLIYLFLPLFVRWVGQKPVNANPNYQLFIVIRYADDVF